MNMNATVIQTEPGSLLVIDASTGGEVRVIFRDAQRFSPGDNVSITFTGTMTHSIPPQITATSIQRIQGQPQPTPREMRAIILQRRRNALLVRDMRNNRQILVNFPYAHHFCARQRVIVKYDTITLSNPPEVNATDVAPIC